MNAMDAPPLSVVYDLSDLSEAGAEITVAATPEQRAQLAKWVKVDSVEKFEGLVSLKRLSATRFAYRAEISADVIQSCVVTLEPVPSHLALEIDRSLLLVKLPRRGVAGPQEVFPASDEGPEQIEDTRYDIAAPLLEEFSLAIEPYPRAPGVVFNPPADEDSTRSPFEALKSLKRDG